MEVEEKTCQVHVKLGDGAGVLALPEGCASGLLRGTITAGPDGVDCAGVDQIDGIEDEDIKKLISKMCSDDDADVAIGRPGCMKQTCWCMDASDFYKCKESSIVTGGLVVRSLRQVVGVAVSVLSVHVLRVRRGGG